MEKQLQDAIRLLYEARDVLGNYYFTGSYNNEDVIAMDDKITRFLDSLTTP